MKPTTVTIKGETRVRLKLFAVTTNRPIGMLADEILTEGLNRREQSTKLKPKKYGT